jgi:signal transduction histidine kinase
LKTVRKVWQFLTLPHASSTDIEQRRQSQLLAQLMVSVFVTSVIASLLMIYSASGAITSIVTVLWLGLLFTLAQYFLNRAGYYKVSATLFVGNTFVLVNVMPFVTHELSWLFFSTMLVILTAVLLPKWTTRLFVVSILGQITMGNLSPISTYTSILSTTIVFGVTGPLVIVFMNHRAGLERERQEELREANQKLRESEIVLERRVEERTRDLTIAADVSSQIAAVLNLDELLPQIVQQTREGYNFYHTSVFLFDEKTSRVSLRASVGRHGSVMKPGSQTFGIQDRGLVPRAARERQPVLINDVNSAQDYFNNPNLPETRAELAIPVIIGSKLIGVLDLQSEIQNRFTENELRILQTLAEQIGVAVENARLYSEQMEVAKELRELDNMKSQFLASMSHELRTPLNAILNFTKFVSMEVYGSVTEQQHDALGKIVGSAQHLLSLINDVLDVTKIEAGMMQLFIEADVDPQLELQTVIATAETLLSEKPVELIRDIDANLPLIVGDRRRVRQILLNLVSNACKFTEVGRVTISAKNRGDELLFAVSDTGPGIAHEDLDIIFEPFRQTEHGVKHAGGTGLGLPISRKLVAAHGGRLWVESEVGDGSTFYLTLPVRSLELVEAMGLS